MAEKRSPGIVVVFGSVNVDATSYVRAFPRPGETVHSHGFRIALGGKGANQAVASHRAGATVELVARVGDDAAAEVPLRAFSVFGLATDGVNAVPGWMLLRSPRTARCSGCTPAEPCLPDREDTFDPNY